LAYDYHAGVHCRLSQVELLCLQGRAFGGLFLLVYYTVSVLIRAQKVKCWYYNHAKRTQDSGPEVPPLSLSGKPPRKPVRLALHQAYSLLFCQKDSPLHSELHEKWTAFINNDPTTVNEYGHLFSKRGLVPAKFVVFQQALLREKMPTISADELRQVHEFIEARYEEETNLYHQPWHAMKVDEGQTEADLEKQYIAR